VPEVGPAIDRVRAAIRDSGLVPEASRGVVMLSGGPDSTAMLVGLVRLLGPDGLVAIHLNYGLRSDSDDDQDACDRTCRQLGVELIVRRPGQRDGNMHDWARRERYRAAESLRSERDLEWIAVGHTSTDLAETVLYRLASSPGTRALAAMPARRGDLIRPLLALDRATVRTAAIESGLPFVDDLSNLDPSFARSRIRGEVLPVLEDINPAAVENIVRTRREVEEESGLVGSIAEGLISRDSDGEPIIAAGVLAEAHPAVARHAIRMLVEVATAGHGSASIPRTAEIRRLCGRPEGGSVDLGGGVTIAVESGMVVVLESGEIRQGPEPAILDLPGEVEWGAWRLAAERIPGPVRARGPEVATLDAAGLPDRIEVRAWCEGDRIRQLGMAGSKPVADILAERGIRRTERRTHPVVVAAGEVVWVPGMAVADRLRIAPDTPEVVLLTADRSGNTGAP
jgi:tRNA(Ile)-lysidine synthase